MITEVPFPSLFFYLEAQLEIERLKSLIKELESKVNMLQRDMDDLIR